MSADEDFEIVERSGTSVHADVGRTATAPQPAAAEEEEDEVIELGERTSTDAHIVSGDPLPTPVVDNDFTRGLNRMGVPTTQEGWNALTARVLQNNGQPQSEFMSHAFRAAVTIVMTWLCSLLHSSPLSTGTVEDGVFNDFTVRMLIAVTVGPIVTRIAFRTAFRKPRPTSPPAPTLAATLRTLAWGTVGAVLDTFQHMMAYFYFTPILIERSLAFLVPVVHVLDYGVQLTALLVAIFLLYGHMNAAGTSKDKALFTAKVVGALAVGYFCTGGVRFVLALIVLFLGVVTTSLVLLGCFFGLGLLWRAVFPTTPTPPVSAVVGILLSVGSGVGTFYLVHFVTGDSWFDYVYQGLLRGVTFSAAMTTPTAAALNVLDAPGAVPTAPLDHLLALYLSSGGLYIALLFLCAINLAGQFATSRIPSDPSAPPTPQQSLFDVATQAQSQLWQAWQLALTVHCTLQYGFVSTLVTRVVAEVAYKVYAAFLWRRVETQPAPPEEAHTD